jgi:hypothetical protein
MMKLASALATAAVFSTSAIAAPVGGTVNQTIDVHVTLAAKCVANNGATNPLVDFGTYTAFGATAPAPTTNVSFKCSRGLAPGAAFLGSGYTLAGLSYTLGVDAGAKTAASGATDYDAWTYVVTGGMVAGQAGDGTLNGLQTATQTLQISF